MKESGIKTKWGREREKKKKKDDDDKKTEGFPGRCRLEGKAKGGMKRWTEWRGGEDAAEGFPIPL